MSEQEQSADDFWNAHVGALRKKLGFAPLTPEEAEAAYDAAEPIPLSEERIEEMVRRATEKDQ